MDDTDIYDNPVVRRGMKQFMRKLEQPGYPQEEIDRVIRERTITLSNGTEVTNLSDSQIDAHVKMLVQHRPEFGLLQSVRAEVAKYDAVHHARKKKRRKDG